MLTSIKIMLVIAIYHDYEIWQMDIKTIFLNGNFKEDVYITQFDGSFLLDRQTRYASCKSPSMDLNRLQGVGTFILITLYTSSTLSKMKKNHMCIRMSVGVLSHF